LRQRAGPSRAFDGTALCFDELSFDCLSPTLFSSFRAAMYSFTYFTSVLPAFIPALAGFAAAAPLCSDTINTAGGASPNSGDPILISANAVKEFQLALFLENLESFNFQTGL
jgi:hypothetical protein